MNPYGVVRDKTYPVASLIWGHRLRSGQEWIEYLLEFLNVASGFDYKLGEGSSEDKDAAYKRHKRLGLRRFTFYHDREKTTHKYDDLARDRLLKALDNRLTSSEGAPVERLQELFLGLSALEKNRSWYAKALLPIHENLLMWEALRKGATRRDAVSVDNTATNEHLDADMNFTQRNFFSRGGELYYLLVSAGTEALPERRERIQQNLQCLLQDHHQPIGQLAKHIDDAWESDHEAGSKGEMHYVPDGSCSFYKIIAEDLDELLQAELDVVEKLHLLAHLICFHIVIYIYVLAHPLATSAVLADDDCMDKVRPALLVDALEGADNGVLRRVSATLFKVQEDRIQQRAQRYITEQIATWASESSEVSDEVELLDSRLFKASDVTFSLGAKSSWDAASGRFAKVAEEYKRTEISRKQFINQTIQIVVDKTSGDFRRNFLPVHRKLAKDIGFLGPKTGPNARYTLSDDLLKALTLANVQGAEDTITYDTFLDRLYDRYGLVLNERHARASNLYEHQPINVEYYNRNQAALLAKMIRAGLAHEYSDATAMVAPFRF